MAEQGFDILVIGGGITGTGIALDAASRGLSVALVEKDDFASGTSGRSSRLVHGGFRYLQNGDIKLVRESVRERAIIYRLAPHLVRPLPMYLLADSAKNRAMYRAGLGAYELLAAGQDIGRHKFATKAQVARHVPGLGQASSGYRYYEGRTDDARLTIEVARAAHAHGALLANHAEVTGLLGETRVTGAVVVDRISGRSLEIRATTTVNASGVWADRITGLAAPPASRLVPSKGVHLVFRPGAIVTRAAVALPHEGRFVFVVPWEDRVYAGTTDTAYSGDLDKPEVGEADRRYLLSAVARYFPGITERDTVSHWAGLRPLLGDTDDARTADLSRRHAIFEQPPGLVTITGGKLTTYRAMARDLVDRIAAGRGPCRTGRIALGLHGPVDDALRLATAAGTRLGLPPWTGNRLVRRYGDDWAEALRLLSENPLLGEQAVPGMPVLKVELELARTREMALTDDDIYVRRTRLTTRDVALRPSA